MRYYWAKFKNINNDTFRFDTRVYLNLKWTPLDTDLCIGGVVGKNPGSAMESDCNINGLQQINLNGDKLLPTVRNIFLKAYKQANKQIHNNSYIQVLNLIYICDKDLLRAIKKIQQYPTPIICETEKKKFPFLWYVWGNDNKKLNIYKQRFSNMHRGVNFYFNTEIKKIISNTPGLKDTAKHTQGLKHELVVPYISSMIQNLSLAKPINQAIY